jgi:hypothetical protein
VKISVHFIASIISLMVNCPYVTTKYLMEQANDTTYPAIAATSNSIFDELKPLPVYYSVMAIRVFCILFTVLFGGVLLAMNLNRTESKKGVWQVVIFSLFYSIAGVAIMNAIPKANSGITLVINAGGAYIMEYLFWNKYIGKTAEYTKRSVLVPALIGIALAIGFIVVTLISAKLI